MSAEYDYVFKFVIVGDAGIGKTSLLIRYSDGTFGDAFLSPVGIDFRIQAVDLHGKVAKLQIWDTAGQERFRTITPSYYRGAHGILICYDVTYKTSFDHSKHWLDEVRKHARGHVDLMLVGTKCDCTSRPREVQVEDGQAFAEANQMLFFETSAKEDINIQEAFQKFAATVLARVDPPSVVFTIVTLTPTNSGLKLLLTKPSGKEIHIDLIGFHPTVEVATIAIGETCGVSSRSVKLITSEGVLLNVSDPLPGCAAVEHDAWSNLRCSVQ